jgi:hypothetical protein
MAACVMPAQCDGCMCDACLGVTKPGALTVCLGATKPCQPFYLTASPHEQLIILLSNARFAYQYGAGHLRGLCKKLLLLCAAAYECMMHPRADYFHRTFVGGSPSDPMQLHLGAQCNSIGRSLAREGSHATSNVLRGLPLWDCGEHACVQVCRGFVLYVHGCAISGNTAVHTDTECAFHMLHSDRGRWRSLGGRLGWRSQPHAMARNEGWYTGCGSTDRRSCAHEALHSGGDAAEEGPVVGCPNRCQRLCDDFAVPAQNKGSV